jgi:hypothetical protein
MKSIQSDWQLSEARQTRHPHWCDPDHCTVRTDLIGANGLPLAQWGQHRAQLTRDTPLKSTGLTLTVGQQAPASDEDRRAEIWLRLSSMERSMELAMTPRDAYRFATAIVEAVRKQDETA